MRHSCDGVAVVIDVRGLFLYEGNSTFVKKGIYTFQVWILKIFAVLKEMPGL